MLVSASTSLTEWWIGESEWWRNWMYFCGGAYLTETWGQEKRNHSDSEDLGRPKSRQGGFHGDLVVKSLPAMPETQVQSLGQEDPLEKGMATHPSILAWRVPWTEEPSGL